jgi:hypothetical protein
MTPPPSPWRLRDEPSAAEREQIDRRKRLVHLGYRDAPGVLDWPTLARRLAGELAELAARLSGDPYATQADHERVQRARAVVRDYQTASHEIEP